MLVGIHEPLDGDLLNADILCTCPRTNAQVTGMLFTNAPFGGIEHGFEFGSSHFSM